MKTIKQILLIALLSTSFAHAATTIEKSQIDFTAVGNPSFIKASGTLNFKHANLKLMEDQLSGEIVVDMNKLDTEIELRDEHLKENYLETKKFPEAKLTLAPFELKDGENKTQKIKSTLELHGVKKEIELELTVTRHQQQVKVVGDFELKLSDHKIELPSFQGITAADKVKLKVEADLKL